MITLWNITLLAVLLGSIDSSQPSEIKVFEKFGEHEPKLENAVKEIMSFFKMIGLVEPYWPCPEPTSLAPCVCSSPDELSTDIDCSDVNSDEELAQSFTATFSFPMVRTLTIQPAERSSLHTFSSETFGVQSFQNVIVSNTMLQEIQDGAFAESRDYLVSLDLSDNNIVTFPYESLASYTLLENLNLQKNNLGFQDFVHIESDSLKSVDMSFNTGLYRESNLFGACPKLSDVNMNDCAITELGSNIFGALSSLTHLDLSNNNLTSLKVNDITPPSTSMKYLNLNNNYISNMEDGAITGEKKH